MKYKFNRVYLLLLVLFISPSVLSGTSHAEKTAISPFETSFFEKNVELKLRGSGTFTWMGIIKAYRGGLYLPENIHSSKLFENVPKRLVLEYFQSIKAVDFYRATRKHIEKYTDKKTLEKIEPQLVKLGQTYQNVKPNDRYALTYFPGKGTSLSLNGKLLGTFEGETFSRVMFSIWMGDHPIDKKFRDQLLGRK